MLAAGPRLCAFREGGVSAPAERVPSAPKSEEMRLHVLQRLTAQPRRKSQILRKSVLLI